MSQPDEKIPVFGTDFKSKAEDVEVTLYEGHYYGKQNLQIQKDKAKGKINRIEKPVDDFNKLIRQCRE